MSRIVSTRLRVDTSKAGWSAGGWKRVKELSSYDHNRGCQLRARVTEIYDRGPRICLPGFYNTIVNQTRPWSSRRTFESRGQR